ncbi:MAG: FHA domain-containing protein, partial [Ktedonobacterales bacterium]
MAYLEIETRDGTHRVNLERDRVSIGRLSYNDVVLPYAQISRQHAELRLLNGQWWITDMQSTNGIQINARRVQEHALTNGDQIVLAPTISLRFVDDAAQPDQPAQPAQPLRSDESGTSWAERVREQFALPGGVSPVSPSSLTQPARPARPTAGPDPFASPDSLTPSRPRSPFSDDEVRYVPPSMQPPAPPNVRPSFPSHPTGAPGIPGRPPSDVSENPFAALYGSAANDAATPGRPGANGGNGSLESFGAGAFGGYPAPPGPLRSGAGSGDPFQRNGPLDERQRATSSPASNLLHVCQTCGQLTAPDSVYCQSCHHSIAHECSNCRLSL